MLSAWQAISPKTLTDPFREFVNPLLRQSTKLRLNPCMQWITIHEDIYATSLRARGFRALQNRAGNAAHWGGFAEMAKTPRRSREESPPLWCARNSAGKCAAISLP